MPEIPKLIRLTWSESYDHGETWTEKMTLIGDTAKGAGLAVEAAVRDVGDWRVQLEPVPNMHTVRLIGPFVQVLGGDIDQADTPPKGA